jgi:predicted ATPase
MAASLDEINIQGYKSIRELKNLKLGPLTVLVGANGAGKSNFVDFFHLLRAMSEERLQAFVTDGGGADGYAFKNNEETPEIKAHLVFGQNEYRFSLKPTLNGKMAILSEGVLYRGGGSWSDYNGPREESLIKQWEKQLSHFHNGYAKEHYIYAAVSKWVVYHVHNTSTTAPMRRERPYADNRELASDVGNLAAFLARMRSDHSVEYRNLLSIIRSIAPFFDDFILEPFMKGDNELVKLDWRQKGNRSPMQPWQLSDGTLRFIALAAALRQPRMPSTILIDEPELGLHPAALSALTELIKEAADETQIIISTQSPALLDDFKPEVVLVAANSQGETKFDRLDAEGIKLWLDDYRLGDLVRKNVIDAGPRYA